MSKKLFKSKEDLLIVSRLPLNYSLIESVSSDINNLSKEYLEGRNQDRPVTNYQSDNTAIYVYPNLISKSFNL